MAPTALLASEFELAVAPYRFEFPRDHFEHPRYQTEWWYYTGNLTASGGHRFGFELTFFRYRPAGENRNVEENRTWSVSQIYIAHFALTDLNSSRFLHEERINRGGPGLAGIDQAQRTIWNGNWNARWLTFTPAKQQIEAVTSDARLSLTLTSLKPPVIHGKNGVSQKGPLPGEASHYYSYTRLAASGAIHTAGHRYQVNGWAWMDREFFTSVPNDPTAGWDWMSLQLDSGEELMIYRLRLKDGTVSAYSAGTWVRRNGTAEFMASDSFVLAPEATWRSPRTGGVYPVAWKIVMPGKRLELRISTAVKNQELVNRVTRSYWEGAVEVTGTVGGKRAGGRGYLEMTGYAAAESSRRYTRPVER